jgi:succinate dehydrogenase / fumarate reductase, cytochrome b subunit
VSRREEEHRMPPDSQRPLSPHLQIYRPELTMVMSIVHRLTGAALYFGSILLVGWLSAAAAGGDYFAFIHGIYVSWFGMIVLFVLSWALVHHFIGGIRHLIWDTGRGLDLPTAQWMAQMNLAGSVAITIAIWIAAYLAKG